jgi:FlaA1/EpsC-like NDP-sugar epimerase
LELTVINNFSGKTVLVTGACGTCGAELVRQLVDSPVEQIICLDNNETELFFILETYRKTGKVSGYLADIRDLNSLRLRMHGVDVVIHSAAYKHVGLCEDSPNQAIQTNIQGTQNVIDAALEAGVERVLFTSSDKAVNPTNVMGTSKLMGERLMTAAAGANGRGKTIFASTRFGNVLGSRGSVIPLFERQIAQGGPVTLTHPDMTRFVMTMEEAAELVLRSAWIAKGGEVFVLKMPVARIADLAQSMCEILAPEGGIEIEECGVKPGEKMYEELMNEEEVRRSFEIDDYFVVLPAFESDYAGRFPYTVGGCPPETPYSSRFEPALSLAALTDLTRQVVNAPESNGKA